MIGQKKLEENFKKLISNERLSHAYLFFGERQVGKFLFAKHLAGFLETSKFGSKSIDVMLKETLIISPDEKGAIGIDAVREIPRFMLQKPVFSKRRIVIIRNAEDLTTEAQNAILKIVENPPEAALIILVAGVVDNLLPTIISRLQKIYFPNVSKGEIEEFLVKEMKVAAAKASLIAEESFGRPGRAIELATNGGIDTAKKEVRDFKNANPSGRHSLIKDWFDDKTESNFDIDKFFESLIVELHKDPVKNFAVLKEALHRLALVKQFNTNKKLQLEAIITK